MRALISGLSVVVALTLTTTSLAASEVRQFEIQNLRLGMTASEVKAVGKNAGIGELREIRGPSFDQAVAMAQRKSVLAGSFAGTQEFLAKTPKSSIQISMIPTPQGPKSWRIVYSWLDPSANRDGVREEVFRRYGKPERQIDREWLWGDTATFFDARTKPYLEFRLDPASAGVEKPIAILTLADQSMQRSSREAIEREARK